MSIERRLFWITVVHGLFGTGFNLDNFINYYQPVLAPLVNESLHLRYGVALDRKQFDWLWSLLADSANVGKLLGSLTVGYCMDKFGRRDTAMILRNLLAILACAAETLSKQYFELLFVGHFLGGIVTATKVALLVYIAECVPTEHRGLIVITTGLFERIWKAATNALCLPQVLNNEKRWLYYPIANAVSPLLHLLFVLVLPRSPKYLYITERQRTKSMQSITYYQGKDADTAAILTQYDSEADLGRSATKRNFWRQRHVRLPFLICLVASMAYPFSALTVRGQYSNDMLVSFGIPADKTMLFFFIVNTATIPGALIATFTIERFGRRPLFLGTMILAVGGVSGLFGGRLASDLNAPVLLSATLGVTGMVLGIVALVLGIYTLPQLLIGELCTQHNRAWVSTVTSTAHNSITILLVLIFQPLQRSIGAFSYTPMLVGELLCLIWLYFYLPETKNQSVDAIVSKFKEKRPSENTPLLSD